jgi:hypothetical protein
MFNPSLAQLAALPFLQMAKVKQTLLLSNIQQLVFPARSPVLIMCRSSE